MFNMYFLRTKPRNINFLRGLKSFIQETSKEKLNIVKNHHSPLCDCNGTGTLQKCNASNKCQYRVSQVPVYIKTYGCQMNVSDSNTVVSVLKEYGYNLVQDEKDAEIYLLMTCAIRESAENRIWGKLQSLKGLKESKRHPLRQVGLLGCMAERLKDKVLEKSKLVDIIAGPDAYRDLPRLFAVNQLTQEKAVNCLLSFDETYSDIAPVIRPNDVSSFISITRGCDNLCTYCIVPFTRGRERSRPIISIIEESKALYQSGIKQVILLGQNVNSYRDLATSPMTIGRLDIVDSCKEKVSTAAGFKTVYKPKTKGLTFDVLLEEVAKRNPEMRVRFTSPHPKDFTDDVIKVMQKYPNIAKCVHLPAQSGSNFILERMRRGYTREDYLNLIERMRSAMPNLAITSDFICGFCGETEKDHELTMNLIREVKYNFIYVFPYSVRGKTYASHHFEDDVDQEVKNKRVKEVDTLFNQQASNINQALIGTEQLVLVEGLSKRSSEEYQGRIDNNLKMIISKQQVCDLTQDEQQKTLIKPGDYVLCRVDSSTSHTLKGTPIGITTLTKYHKSPDLMKILAAV